MNLFSADSLPREYHERLAAVVFEPWAAILLDRVGIEDGNAVLDVACGTGVVSRRAAQAAGLDGQVIGLDLSAAMLSQAAELSAPPGSAPIDYVEGSALELPFDTERFDIVVCQQGLQFFPDRAAAVAEFHRVLKPGGTLGLSVWDVGHRIEPFDHYAQVLASIGVQEPFPGAFAHETFTMSVDDVRGLLTDAGFQSVTAAVITTTLTWPGSALPATGILGTPFAPLVHALDPDRRRQLEAHLTARFGPSGSAYGPSRLSAAVLATAARA